MLSRFPHWVRLGLLLALMTGSQSGCQSWRAPSFNMFPWSKKPSPEKIVGTKPPSTLPSAPSNSGATALVQDTSNSLGPISPASRNTPSPIPGSPTVGSSVNMAMAGNPSGSMQPASMAGGAIPSPGTAAANNGFTPGNYNLPQSRMPPNATASMASNPYGGAPTSAVPYGANPGSMNPYGSTLPTTPNNPVNASYNGGPVTVAPGQAGVNYPNNIPNLPAAYGGPSLPPAGSPGPASYGPSMGLPPSSNLPPSMGLPPSSSFPPGSSLPPSMGLPPGGMAPQGYSVPTTPSGGLPVGSLSQPATLPGLSLPVNPNLPPSAAMPSGAAMPPGAAMPSGGSMPAGFLLPPSNSMTAPAVTVPAVTVPAVTVSQGQPGLSSAPAGAYRPGSVGRSTSYDFSGQSQVR